MFEELTKELATQREEADALRVALQEANRANIEAQHATSIQLQAIHEEERKAAEEEKQRLKEQVFQLIDSSSEQQQERLSHRLKTTQASLVAATEQFENADKNYGDGMDKWAIQDSQVMSKVVSSKDELKGKMKGDWTVRIQSQVSFFAADTNISPGNQCTKLGNPKIDQGGP